MSDDNEIELQIVAIVDCRPTCADDWKVEHGGSRFLMEQLPAKRPPRRDLTVKRLRQVNSEMRLHQLAAAELRLTGTMHSVQPPPSFQLPTLVKKGTEGWFYSSL